MSNKSYAVFIDDEYYYDFVALYNSWKYYGNTIPIKVYSYFNLSEDKKIAIKKHCELIEDTNPGYDMSAFRSKQMFKYYALSRHMNEYEMILDADMLFLNNNDHLLDYAEEGLVVGSSEDIGELIYKISSGVKKPSQWPYLVTRTQQLLNPHIGEKSKRYTESLSQKILNGGFLGFSKKKHMPLIKKVIDVMSDKKIPNINIPFDNEQSVVNLLIKLMGLEYKDLPANQWMNTWWNHSKPKKIIKVEDQEMRVYDEEGYRLNMYHFTGGIGMPHPSQELTGDGLAACRNKAWFGSCGFFGKDELEELWFKKKECPVFMLFVYFASKGLS